MTSSVDRAGHTQWYLCDETPSRVVGEVVLIGTSEGTYYAELCNGKGLRYFTTVDDAKAWLWSFYALERAS